MKNVGWRPLSVIACAALLTAGACRRDEPPPVPETTSAAATSSAAVTTQDLRDADVEMTIPLRPNVVTRCASGSKGAEKTTFTRGEPIELVLTLAEAPPGLKVAAQIVGADDATVARADVEAAGKKAVTVTIAQPIEPGSYTLEGYWGGNLVCEHAITIR